MNFSPTIHNLMKIVSIPFHISFSWGRIIRFTYTRINNKRKRVAEASNTQIIRYVKDQSDRIKL